jgi:hypothetical protein
VTLPNRLFVVGQDRTVFGQTTNIVFASEGFAITPKMSPRSKNLAVAFREPNLEKITLIGEDFSAGTRKKFPRRTVPFETGEDDGFRSGLAGRG